MPRKYKKRFRKKRYYKKKRFPKPAGIMNRFNKLATGFPYSTFVKLKITASR